MTRPQSHVALTRGHLAEGLRNQIPSGTGAFGFTFPSRQAREEQRPWYHWPVWLEGARGSRSTPSNPRAMSGWLHCFLPQLPHL